MAEDSFCITFRSDFGFFYWHGFSVLLFDAQYLEALLNQSQHPWLLLNHFAFRLAQFRNHDVLR